jgi:hypothetical protein
MGAVSIPKGFQCIPTNRLKTNKQEKNPSFFPFMIGGVSGSPAGAPFGKQTKSKSFAGTGLM